MRMTRREFVESAGATVALAVSGCSFPRGHRDFPCCDYAALQHEIDEVNPADFKAYLEGVEANRAAFRRLDDAFLKVRDEVTRTVVTDVPAVWLVYNMGIVVKTRESVFSVDLMHRKAPEFEPLLDFAMISHNHNDHYTEAFYRAMNGAGKTVISNFKDNNGAANWRMGGEWWKRGGYTRAVKTFRIKDVEIRTTLTDHNGYLVDFTTAFEIRCGGYMLYHSGDCCNVGKLNPERQPDLWIVHPYCGMKADDGVRKFHPKLTAIAHLNEMGHARDKWRWAYEDGVKAADIVKAAGGKAIVPTWGARLV